MYVTDTANNNEETTFSTHVSIWYVMTCISGKADSCASQAIEPKFEGTVSLTNFEGSTAEIIVQSAAAVLGKPEVFVHSVMSALPWHLSRR